MMARLASCVAISQLSFSRRAIYDRRRDVIRDIRFQRIKRIILSSRGEYLNTVATGKCSEFGE